MAVFALSAGTSRAASKRGPPMHDGRRPPAENSTRADGSASARHGCAASAVLNVSGAGEALKPRLWITSLLTAVMSICFGTSAIGRRSASRAMT